MDLLERIKLLTAADAASAATTTLNGSIVLDLMDYDGVIVFAALGDVTSGCVLNLKLQGNASNSTTGMTDITGATTGDVTATGTSADLKLLAVDVHRPAQRYVRPVLARGTANAVVNGMYAILYRGRKCGPGLLGDLIGGKTVTG